MTDFTWGNIVGLVIPPLVSTFLLGFGYANERLSAFQHHRPRQNRKFVLFLLLWFIGIPVYTIAYVSSVFTHTSQDLQFLLIFISFIAWVMALEGSFRASQVFYGVGHEEFLGM